MGLRSPGYTCYYIFVETADSTIGGCTLDIEGKPNCPGDEGRRHEVNSEKRGMYTLRKTCYNHVDPPHPVSFWHFLDRLVVES